MVASYMAVTNLSCFLEAIFLCIHQLFISYGTVDKPAGGSPGPGGDYP